MGGGSFGEVYDAEDVRTGGRAAVKAEPIDARHPQLIYEQRIMEELHNVPGIPRVHYFGQYNGTHNVLVMQRLDLSVEHVRESAPGGRLPVPVVIYVATEILQRLYALHSRFFAHRDIKPDNFVFGTDGAGGRTLLYLIDFGLSKRMVEITDPTRRHIDIRDGKPLLGTPRYASLGTHAGCEQARRDDIESLGYVLVYLAKGRLPWQSVAAQATPDDTYKEIARIKQRVPLLELCDGLPSAFMETISYARKLRFDAMPDYRYLDALWAAAAAKHGKRSPYE